ncbi:Hypothetical predicted protein [Olea europaea subsp. europaea]|uniref:SHSP domain-containing protein n=1 Tax=Olea europaea subsp. europaea TaxID=158383 RepID=A0A8S0U1B7_OLEEU|nr:Hypothetical predicted protein [Olea europaea subsp. europaea]
MSVYPLFSDPFFSEPFGFGSTPSSFSSSMDWKETPEAHIFKFDLPGVSKEDVELQVYDDRVLHLSAERKDEDHSGKGDYKWHCRERFDSGNFFREFRLPENAIIDEIKASMRDGVLVVTVPKDQHKKKKKKPMHKAVEITGEGEAGSTKGIGRFVCCKA